MDEPTMLDALRAYRDVARNISAEAAVEAAASALRAQGFDQRAAWRGAVLWSPDLSADYKRDLLRRGYA